MGLVRRTHSWPVIAGLICRPHRADPEGIVMYQHISAVARAVRAGPQAREWWDYLRGRAVEGHRAGPRSLWCRFVQRLQLDEVDGETLARGASRINWARRPLPEVLHF